MHLPSQLKTNELIPSIIQKNIHIFLSAKDIRKTLEMYVQITLSQAFR